MRPTAANRLHSTEPNRSRSVRATLIKVLVALTRQTYGRLTFPGRTNAGQVGCATSPGQPPQTSSATSRGRALLGIRWPGRGWIRCRAAPRSIGRWSVVV